MNRLLDLYWLFLLALLITGGGVVRVATAKIEFSEVDLWSLGFCLCLGLRLQLRPHEPLGPVLTRTVSLLRWLLCNKSASAKSGKSVLVMIGVSLFIAHTFKHWNLSTHYFDVSYVHQPLFYPFTSQHILLCDACLNNTYLGEHISFSLLLLAPITSWLKSDECIFAIQVLLFCLPIFFAIRWGPLRHRPELFVFAVLVIFCQRALRHAMVWDFREDDIGFALLFGMIMALWHGKKWWFGVFFFLTLATKENYWAVTSLIAVPVLCESTLNLTRRDRQRLAAFTTLVSIAWGSIVMVYLMPHFSGHQTTQSPVMFRFGALGATPTDVLLSLLTHPIAFFTAVTQHLFELRVLKYVVLLFGPYAFFMRKEGITWLVPVIPGFLMNTLHGYTSQTSMIYHYEAIMLPFLIAASLTGMQHIHALRPLVIGLLVALTLSGRWPGRSITRYWPDAPLWSASQFLNRIPGHVGIIAADATALAQLAHHRRQRLLRVNQPDWEEFLTLNRPTPPQARERYGGDATHFVLDLTHPVQAFIYTEMQKRGFQELAQSPTGRYALLTGQLYK